MNKQNEFLLSVGRTIMKIFARMFLEMDVQFEQPLLPGAKILSANHPTTTDPFLMSLLTNEPLTILVNKKLFNLPVFGKLLSRSGTIPVDKENGNSKEIFTKAIERLEQDHPIGIFPEGSLSPKVCTMARTHTGFARIAVLSKVPIIPIGIFLSQRNIKRFYHNGDNGITESRWILRGRYFVTVGSPVMLNGDINDHNYVKERTSYLTKEINRLINISRERAIQPKLQWKPIIPMSKKYKQIFN